jgi:cation transport ATPase
VKKRIRLTNLDCAACAAKMEDAVRKIPGVNGVSVSFLTQKLTLDADDGRFEEILKQAASVCKKIEPDCKLDV